MVVLEYNIQERREKEERERREREDGEHVLQQFSFDFELKDKPKKGFIDAFMEGTKDSEEYERQERQKKKYERQQK